MYFTRTVCPQDVKAPGSGTVTQSQAGHGSEPMTRILLQYKFEQGRHISYFGSRCQIIRSMRVKLCLPLP